MALSLIVIPLDVLLIDSEAAAASGDVLKSIRTLDRVLVGADPLIVTDEIVSPGNVSPFKTAGISYIRGR